MGFRIETMYHFPIVIPDCTPAGAGVMTPQQLAQLDAAAGLYNQPFHIALLNVGKLEVADKFVPNIDGIKNGLFVFEYIVIFQQTKPKEGGWRRQVVKVNIVDSMLKDIALGYDTVLGQPSPTKITTDGTAMIFLASEQDEENKSNYHIYITGRAVSA